MSPPRPAAADGTKDAAIGTGKRHVFRKRGVPARFRLLEAGDDYVAGVMRDDDDVESVVVFRVVRGG